MNVLSLFDGISCGQLALDKLNIEVDNYYAAEINKEAIKVTMDNYPRTVQLGDVNNLIVLDRKGNIEKVGNKLKKLPKIDLLIGGSPCQGLSRSKPDRENLQDERSRLFYNYVKIKEWLIKNNNSDLIFLLENVKPNQETKEIMDNKMGVKAIKINSKHFSAQDRIRLYWTNLDVTKDNIQDKNLVIKDIIESEQNTEKIKSLKENKEYLETVKFGENYIRWDTSGKGYYSQQNRARYKNKKMNTLTKSNSGDKTRIYLGDYKYRNATVTELERLQTLADGYTSVLNSKIKRKGLIGDGWTVDVIKHIFSSLKE